MCLSRASLQIDKSALSWLFAHTQYLLRAGTPSVPARPWRATELDTERIPGNNRHRPGGRRPSVGSVLTLDYQLVSVPHDD